jgi:hypothetical protein
MGVLLSAQYGLFKTSNFERQAKLATQALSVAAIDLNF